MNRQERIKEIEKMVGNKMKKIIKELKRDNLIDS